MELYNAAAAGNVERVRLAIQRGQDINYSHPNFHGETPLITASDEGHATVVEQLLKAGAEINKADDGGHTPLFIASLRGHVTVVELLLTAGAEVNKAPTSGNYEEATPLWTASYKGHATVVEELLKAGAEVNKARYDGETPLFIARGSTIKDMLRKAGGHE